MDAAVQLYTDPCPCSLREPSFGCHINETWEHFSTELSEYMTTQLVENEGLEVIVMGGIRGHEAIPHWYLIVIQIKAGIVFFFDSLEGQNADRSHKSAMRHIRELWQRQVTAVIPSLAPPSKALSVRFAVQDDGWSCGYHVLKTIMWLYWYPKSFLEIVDTQSEIGEMSAWPLMMMHLQDVTRWEVPQDWYLTAPDAKKATKIHYRKGLKRSAMKQPIKDVASIKEVHEKVARDKVAKSKVDPKPRAPAQKQSGQPVRRSARLKGPEEHPEEEVEVEKEEQAPPKSQKTPARGPSKGRRRQTEPDPLTPTQPPPPKRGKPNQRPARRQSFMELDSPQPIRKSPRKKAAEPPKATPTSRAKSEPPEASQA
ncbi:hypothetical protein F4861DRAFT_544661, partial [Xylaria intraflava]